MATKSSKEKDKEKLVPEFELGYRFDGRYENLEVLGFGGLGTAYKVRDVDSGETHVLKVLSGDVVKNQRIKNRFKKEIKQALELEHKNIAKTLDYGEEEDHVYYVTEFLKGHPLQRVIESRLEDKQKFSIEEVIGILSEVGRALQYAHRNTFHGNLHPYNIFLFKDGVKVTDFCISHVLKPSEFSARQIFQKEYYYYLAPEYDSENPVIDHRSDIYSMGVLAYKLFTGKIPKGDFQRPSLINKEMDPDLDFIIFRAMESNPNDRYQRIKDFLNDLTAVTGRVEMVTEPTTTLGTIRRKKARDDKKSYIGRETLEREDRFSFKAFALAAILIMVIAGLLFGRQYIVPQVKLASGYLATMIDEITSFPDERQFQKTLEQESAMYSLEDKKSLWEDFIARHPDSSALGKAQTRLNSINTQIAAEEKEAQAREFAIFRSIIGKLDTKEEKLAYAKRFHQRHINSAYIGEVENVIKGLEGKKASSVARAGIRTKTPVVSRRSKPKAVVAKTPTRVSKTSKSGSVGNYGRRSHNANLVASLSPVVPTWPPNLCPAEMVLVSGGSFTFGSNPNDPDHGFLESGLINVQLEDFCIDRYEYPNMARAYPLTDVSWHQADQICRNEGKRLCTELEWEKSCKGGGNKRYPYGMAYGPAKCNTEGPLGRDNTLARSGSMPACVSDYGVYDMSGNAEEWTASLLGPGKVDRIARGGSADRPSWAARCSQRDNANPSSRSPYVGFRCCRSLR